MTPDGLTVLKSNEGFRSKVYTDTTGNLTIGYGTNLDAGITEQQATALAATKIDANRELLLTRPWFSNLSPARQDVIENMTYNMGINEVFQFQMMISALATRDFDRAADDMLQSKWAQQVGQRATKLAEIMRKGTY